MHSGDGALSAAASTASFSKNGTRPRPLVVTATNSARTRPVKAREVGCERDKSLEDGDLSDGRFPATAVRTAISEESDSEPTGSTFASGGAVAVCQVAA